MADSGKTLDGRNLISNFPDSETDFLGANGTRCMHDIASAPLNSLHFGQTFPQISRDMNLILMFSRFWIFENKSRITRFEVFRCCSRDLENRCQVPRSLFQKLESLGGTSKGSLAWRRIRSLGTHPIVSSTGRHVWLIGLRDCLAFAFSIDFPRHPGEFEWCSRSITCRLVTVNQMNSHMMPSDTTSHGLTCPRPLNIWRCGPETLLIARLAIFPTHPTVPVKRCVQGRGAITFYGFFG